MEETMETRSNSALFKRAEQLRRWEESETNRECCTLKDKPRKIKFSQGCIFLAACSAGDKIEVKKLLEKGADINEANVDGLTALHQACIDDNLEMVEFLVEHGADVNRGDNEGWTPLHATASCAFVSIAIYLIENGANVAAVNNDGELPIDIAESDDMEELLQIEIEKRGIDCRLARNEEERLMLEDAHQWLNSKSINERCHPKTGATALHVAAAKGYTKVISILIQAKSNVNAQDFDGWTPLHAAAHWGQKEACEMLTENMCDMDIKNYAGQTPCDVAESELVSFLEELKKKQQMKKRERPEIKAIIDNKITLPLGKRKEVAAERELTNVNNIPEKVVVPVAVHDDSDLEESDEESEHKESEIEKKNKANKEVKSRDIISAIEQLKEVNVKEELKIREPPKQAPTVEEKEDSSSSWRRAVRKPGGSEHEVPPIRTFDEEVTLRTPTRATTNDREQTLSERREHVRPISLQTSEILGSRLGRGFLDRPLSFREQRESFFNTLRPYGYRYTTPVTFLSKTASLPASPILSRTKDEVPEPKKDGVTTPTVSLPLPLASSIATTATSTVSTATATSATITPETPTTAQIRRSFVLPVRDDESESQRKAHAKRVRETRRSTQGVTMEDLKSAEQFVKKQQEDTKPEITSAPSAPVVTVAAQPEEENNKPTVTVARRSSWRVPAEKLESRVPDETENGHWSNDLSAVVSSASSPFTRRTRPISTPVACSDVDTTVTFTLKTRPSSVLPSLESTDAKKEPDKDKENDIKSTPSVQATQAAIQRRRKPKRRSTGVVHYDYEDGESEGKSDEDHCKINNAENKEEEKENANTGVSDRSYRSTGRYGSSSSLSDVGKSDTSRYSDRSDRLSRASSVGSTTSQNDADDKDYKQLYVDAKQENDRLKEKLHRIGLELDDSKQQLEKATQNNSRNSSTDAEKRERRALERKLSEMEEELKQYEKIKVENQRLRDENGALVRVISKLSK